MQGSAKLRGFVCLLAITAFVMAMAGCGGKSPMAVAIGQGNSVSLDNGQTENLTATVANDSKNGGVSWSLSGPGALSAQTTSSATYTAPSSGAAATATVTATSVSDSTKSASITIHLSPVPTIAASPTPSAGTNGTAYSFTVPESGGTTPLTWTVSVGSLPTGLSLSQGVISGTPNADSTPAQNPYSFTVKVTDAATMSATQAYTLTIHNPPAPVISTTAPPAGTNGSAYTAFTFTVSSGGLAPFTWSETGALPTGMSLSAAGVLSGTPTASGSFPITVSVQDSSNPQQTASHGFTITVNNPPPPTIQTGSLPDGTVGTFYTKTILATGGLAPYTWSVSVGTPPAGLSLGGSTTTSVTLSGTPTTAQSNVTFTVQIKDSLNQTGTQQYTVTISNPPPPTISPTSLPDGVVGTAYNQTIQVANGLAPYTWTSSGTVPAGLTVNTPSGPTNNTSITVTGTPTTAETGDTFTVQVTDSLSQVGSQQYTMNITAQPIIVTITNKFTTIQAGAAKVTLNATVQHDTAGVTWTLTANGANCSPASACGTLSNATSTSVDYTPPATVPGAPDNAPTITATSVTDNTKSDTDSFTITSAATTCTAEGNESVLHGQYAFSIAGYNNTGFGAVVGSFTADGTGKITAGELDMNGAIGLNTQVSISATGSSYSLKQDDPPSGGYRGCLIIATSSGTFTTHISVGSLVSNVATKGRVIEWDPTGSSAFIASGQLLQQTASEFSTTLSGNYVFAVMGEDFNATPNPGIIACVGVLPASTFVFGNGEQDCNDVGSFGNLTGMSGSYTAADSSGRITTSVSVGNNAPSHSVLYMVSSSRLLVLTADPQSGSPVQSGEITLQNGTPASTWLDGASAFFMNGISGGGNADATLGVFSGSSGNGTADLYEADGTTFNHNSAACTYTVGSDGRTPLGSNNCGQPPVLYLTGPNSGYIVNGGHGPSMGFIQPQMTGTINTSTVSGTFFMGTNAVPMQVGPSPVIGWITANNGSVTGLSDNTSTSNQNPGGAISATISVGSDGTSNGWVTVSNDSISPSMLVVDTNTLWRIDSNNGYPTLTILEK